MERLLATSGGRPLKLEDLVLNMQVTTMLESLISKLGQEIIIVSGCEISSIQVDTFAVSAGIIWYDGKFWAFDSVASFTSSLGFSMNLAASVVEDTPRTHFDGVSRNTIETSKLVYTTGTPDVVFDSNTPRLEDWLTKGAGLTTKIIEIGDWNMDATDYVLVAHGLSATEYKTIRVVDCIIRDDGDTARIPLFAASGSGGDRFGGTGGITSTNINLNRLIGGLFDNASYDSTLYNRGWITIQYIAD